MVDDLSGKGIERATELSEAGPADDGVVKGRRARARALIEKGLARLLGSGKASISVGATNLEPADFAAAQAEIDVGRGDHSKVHEVDHLRPRRQTMLVYADTPFDAVVVEVKD